MDAGRQGCGKFPGVASMWVASLPGLPSRSGALRNRTWRARGGIALAWLVTRGAARTRAGQQAATRGGRMLTHKQRMNQGMHATRRQQRTHQTTPAWLPRSSTRAHAAAPPAPAEAALGRVQRRGRRPPSVSQRQHLVGGHKLFQLWSDTHASEQGAPLIATHGAWCWHARWRNPKLKPSCFQPARSPSIPPQHRWSPGPTLAPGSAAAAGSGSSSRSAGHWAQSRTPPQTQAWSPGRTAGCEGDGGCGECGGMGGGPRGDCVKTQVH